MWRNPQKTARLVTLTEEILNEKLHFLHNDSCFVISKHIQLIDVKGNCFHINKKILDHDSSYLIYKLIDLVSFIWDRRNYPCILVTFLRRLRNDEWIGKNDIFYSTIKGSLVPKLSKIPFLDVFSMHLSIWYKLCNSSKIIGWEQRSIWVLAKSHYYKSHSFLAEKGELLAYVAFYTVQQKH